MMKSLGEKTLPRFNSLSTLQSEKEFTCNNVFCNKIDHLFRNIFRVEKYRTCNNEDRFHDISYQISLN